MISLNRKLFIFTHTLPNPPLPITNLKSKLFLLRLVAKALKTGLRLLLLLFRLTDILSPMSQVIVMFETALAHIFVVFEASYFRAIFVFEE